MSENKKNSIKLFLVHLKRVTEQKPQQFHSFDRTKTRLTFLRKIQFLVFILPQTFFDNRKFFRLDSSYQSLVEHVLEIYKTKLETRSIGNLTKCFSP